MNQGEDFLQDDVKRFELSSGHFQLDTLEHSNNSSLNYGNTSTLSASPSLKKEQKAEIRLLTKSEFDQMENADIWTLFDHLYAQESEENTKTITQLKKEAKENSLLSWRTINDKMKQDVEFEILRRNHEVVTNELRETKSALEEASKEISFLKQDLESKNEANFKMALKLLEYKTKVSGVELQLRKFPAKRVYRIYPNADVNISVLKNPQSGLISFDIEENRRHTTKPLKSITKVQGTNNRFQVSYGDNTSPDIFESDRASEILTSIQEILQ